MPTRTPQLCCRFLFCSVLAAWLVAPSTPASAVPPPWNWQGGVLAKVSQQSLQGSGQEPNVFPTLSAEALDKTLLVVPTQLEGRQNLLLLSWARDQAPQLDTWTAVAQALQHASFDFRVYRMPVSAPENALFRWWDNASLRAAETDPELLHWTVPLYTDIPVLRHTLGIAGNNHTVVALLVDRSGHILWKAQGTSTVETRASLLAAAQALH